MWVESRIATWTASVMGLSPPNVSHTLGCYPDDVIKWKHFPRCWPFVRGIHRSPVYSPHKGQWHGALMNKRLSKQSWGWWFETLSCPLWRHRNDIVPSEGITESEYDLGLGGQYKFIPRPEWFSILVILSRIRVWCQEWCQNKIEVYFWT